MKRLLLINPVQKKSGYLLSQFTRFPPLSLAYLAGVTPEDWEVKIIDENFAPFEYEEADLVGITAFTSSINRAYEISNLYRKHNIKVVLGGIHASMVEDEILNYADAVVVGECESVWPKLLADFSAGRLQQVYRGERIDLSNNPPRPRRDLLNPGYLWQSVQTSRGCPFDCTFCSVSRYLGRGFRQRTAEDVLDELESLPGRFVTFVDDNLIGNSAESRERARRIFQGMIDRKMNKTWWMQTSINIAEDDELLRLASKSGCMIAFVGFETIDDAGLREMHKGVNVKIGVDHYKDVVDSFHRHGIGVMGGFIIGNDFESDAYYRKFAHFLLESNVDIAQISILTPLPGTDLYERMEKSGRLLYKSFPEDWVKYRLSRVVHEVKGISAETVYRGDNYLKKTIYTGRGLRRRMFKCFFAIRNPWKFLGILFFNRAMRRSWEKSYYYDKFPHTLGTENDREEAKNLLYHGE